MDDLRSPNPSCFDGRLLASCIFRRGPLVPHRLLGFRLSEKRKAVEGEETVGRLCNCSMSFLLGMSIRRAWVDLDCVLMDLFFGLICSWTFLGEVQIGQ